MHGVVAIVLFDLCVLRMLSHLFSPGSQMRLDVETLQQQILEPSGGGDGHYFERPQGIQDRAPKDTADRTGDRPSDGPGRGAGEGNSFGLLEVGIQSLCCI
jgi:hypothetical protein